MKAIISNKENRILDYYLIQYCDKLGNSFNMPYELDEKEIEERGLLKVCIINVYE